mgnify:FL=1|tara:strand:+ start:1445 stop:1798 length:354 start_codon:yes stop_codon:yes gene_type:complete
MVNAVSKAEIAEFLIERFDFMDKVEAKHYVDNFFELIIQSLSQGKCVKLSKFGNFDLRDKKARPGRNPKTKEEVMITPRRVVTFHAGQKMRNLIKDSLSNKPKALDDGATSSVEENN